MFTETEKKLFCHYVQTALNFHAIRLKYIFFLNLIKFRDSAQSKSNLKDFWN